MKALTTEEDDVEKDMTVTVDETSTTIQGAASGMY